MLLVFILPHIITWAALGMPTDRQSLGILLSAVLSGILALVKELLGGQPPAKPAEDPPTDPPADGPISYAIPIAIEIVSIVMIAIGVGIEIMHRAEAGYVLISIGSVLAVLGSFLWTKVLKRVEKSNNRDRC